MPGRGTRRAACRVRTSARPEDWRGRQSAPKRDLRRRELGLHPPQMPGTLLGSESTGLHLRWHSRAPTNAIEQARRWPRPTATSYGRICHVDLRPSSPQPETPRWWESPRHRATRRERPAVESPRYRPRPVRRAQCRHMGPPRSYARQCERNALTMSLGKTKGAAPASSRK